MLNSIRNVKFILNMRKLTLTAVCVLFLIKLRWPKNKSLYDKLVVVVVLLFQVLLVKRLLKLRITVLKYFSWYLCQISLQILQLPIQINHLFFISRSSSFPVIDVSVDIKSKSKKKTDSALLLSFPGDQDGHNGRLSASRLHTK